MFKNMLKRTWLSIKRKRGKTTVLVLLMFVMANLVLASLLIKNAVSENVELIKESLGSEIYLSTDTESLMEAMQSEVSSSDSTSQSEGMQGGMGVSMYRPEITLDMVLEIGTSDYLRDLTYSASTSAYADDFTAVESDEEEMSFMGGQSFGMTSTVGDVLIEGINAYAYISEVENGTMEIVDGDYFDESTDDSAIISYELAEENGLEVGDFIELSNTSDEEVYEIEIIGIFLTSTDGYENTIYMNISTATYFFTDSQYTDDGEIIVSDVVYYLSNPDDSDAFIEEAYEKYPDMADDYLVLDIDNTTYEAMASSIESVGDFANTILIIVIGASVLIITLLINNNVKDRKYEIGVLSALGATKTNIAGQIFLELIVAATIGFVLSFGTSYYVAQSLTDSLLATEEESAEISSESSFGRPSTGQTGGVSSIPGMSMESGTTVVDVEVVDEMDVSVSASSYLLLFVIGYVVSFVAMIIPTVNIMKYEPKTILTGRE